MRVETHNLTVGISAAAAKPYLSPVSRQFRQTIFELRNAALTSLGGGDGIRRRDVLVKAHVSARPSVAERGNLFLEAEVMAFFTPDDLESVLPSELQSVTGPIMHSEMPRELWGAARS